MFNLFRKSKPPDALQVAFLFVQLLWEGIGDEREIFQTIRERTSANEATIRGEFFTFLTMALTMALMQRDFKRVSSRDVYDLTKVLTAVWLQPPDKVPPTERETSARFMAFIESSASAIDSKALMRLKRVRGLLPSFEHHAARFADYHEVLRRYPTEEESRRALGSAFASNVGLPNDPVLMLQANIEFRGMEEMYRNLLPEL